MCRVAVSGKEDPVRFAVCLLAGILGLCLSSCKFEEVKVETGYKGKARMNPWLAAERFTEKRGYDVTSAASWKAPGWEDAVYFVPAAILNNSGFVNRIHDWVENGGHLIVMIDYSETEWNDWRSFTRTETRIEPILEEFLEDAGIEAKNVKGGSVAASEVTFDGVTYEVDASAAVSVKAEGGKGGVLASVAYGEGRVTAVADSRIFRSKFIDKSEHAALLAALTDASPHEGEVIFLRGSGTSIWEMFRRHLWPVLLGLGAMLVLWLWKCFSRFGPVEAGEERSPLRGYDHHLEALGDFQWRLDQANALLAPLRERIIEYGQRLAEQHRGKEHDFFELLAVRSGIPRDRVHRALVERSPADASILTRTAADLKRLLEVIH